MARYTSPPGTYERIRKEVIEDPTLTDAEFRLAVYLTSKPDGWVIRPGHITTALGRKPNWIRDTLPALRRRGWVYDDWQPVPGKPPKRQTRFRRNLLIAPLNGETAGGAHDAEKPQDGADQGKHGITAGGARDAVFPEHGGNRSISEDVKSSSSDDSKGQSEIPPSAAPPVPPLTDSPDDQPPEDRNPEGQNLASTGNDQRPDPGQEPGRLFAAFWDVYPRKAAKAKARAAWAKAVNGGADPQELIGSAARYRDEPGRKPDYTPHPATWLNQERWEDDPAEPTRDGGHQNYQDPPAGAYNLGFNRKPLPTARRQHHPRNPRYEESKADWANDPPRRPVTAINLQAKDLPDHVYDE